MAGSELTLTDVVIRDTLGQDRNDAGGTGLFVQTAGQATVQRALFERNRGSAVAVAMSGSTLELRDVVVRDTLCQASDSEGGRALEVNRGGDAVVERAIFERNRQAGVLAGPAGGTVALTDVLVRDTASNELDGLEGEGLRAQLTGTISGSRIVLDGNRSAGARATDPGSTVVLQDVVVRDMQPERVGEHAGVGLVADNGGRLEASRVLVERALSHGIQATGTGTTVVITDAVVRETLGRVAELDLGIGITIALGAQATLSRVTVDRARTAGLVVSDPGTVATATDLVVQDTQSQNSDRHDGRGCQVQRSAQLDIARALLERNRDCAITGVDSVVLRLQDIVVRDTRTREYDDQWGRALCADDQARMEGDRIVLEHHTEASVLANDPGTSIVLTDVVVRDTRPLPCADTTCPGRGAGSGVVALGGANVELTSFLVTGSAFCGIQLGYGLESTGLPHTETGTADLHVGAVSGNVIGVNVPTVDFDLGRLTDRVAFSDNGTDLDSTALPVPEADLTSP
jgi:hypothetical protein